MPASSPRPALGARASRQRAPSPRCPSPRTPANDAPPKRAVGTYRAWAELLKRTFDVDVFHCPKCNGRMKLVAMVTNPVSIARYLAKASSRTFRRAHRAGASVVEKHRPAPISARRRRVARHTPDRVPGRRTCVRAGENCARSSGDQRGRHAGGSGRTPCRSEMALERCCRAGETPAEWCWICLRALESGTSRPARWSLVTSREPVEHRATMTVPVAPAPAAHPKGKWDRVGGAPHYP